MEELKQREHDDDRDDDDVVRAPQASSSALTSSACHDCELFSSRINVFHLLLQHGRARRLAGPGLNTSDVAGDGRMIAADRAVRWLLMTLSERIKLWLINLDTESMRAAGFIRASFTSRAFIGRVK